MSQTSAPGTLFLVPVSLGPSPTASTVPPEVQRIASRLDYFVAENARSARAELKRLEHPGPMRAIEIRSLPQKPTAAAMDALLEPILAGRDGGLMSDAGCPAVADPGAQLVAAAHRHGVRVQPLVGPSSILLALMGSGLDGQRFAFHGYLPVADAERDARIRELEAESRRQRQTQLFIETPYRNERLFDALLTQCRADTRICIARELTTSDEWIATRPAADWKRKAPPSLARHPVIFLLLAS